MKYSQYNVWHKNGFPKPVIVKTPKRFRALTYFLMKTNS